MCWFARLAISVMVTLMTIAATVEQARAQRLRGPEPWAYERYANNDVKDLKGSRFALSAWNATLKEWDIRDTFCLANVDPEVDDRGDTLSIGLKRPPDAPNYDMNYENVVFMSAGRFYGDEDTTLNGETTFTTPIPSIVLLQHGRLGHDVDVGFLSGTRVLQIFTVESRPFRVLDPLNFNHLEGQRYRRDTTEGLGVVLNAQGRVVSSKYNIMVDSAQTQHPTVLRYDDRSLDATRVRGVAVADLTGDVRDEVVLFYDSGTDTRVIRLSNDSALGHGKPMDYIFTRHNDATVAYATLDVRDLRHTVAGRFIVGTDTVRQVVLFLRDANNAQRIVVARPGTPWTFTEVATPLTTVLDFDALDGVVRTDLDGDGVDEIAFVERRYGSTDVGRIVSGATWTVAAAADRYTLSPQVAAAGRVTAVGGGDVDGDGTDEVVLASRRNNSSNDATLVVVRRQGTTWSDTTSVRADGAHLDGTQVRRLVVANLDYDVRRRGDVAVLYHGDPSASERDDRLLLWRSLPRHADNDYTLDVDTGQGRQPFIPLGWFGIRLSTGLTPRPTPDVIHLTDNWRKLHVWWGPEDQQRRSGYRYIPDSGRIGDALLQDYASIYNTIISERQDYTDGYIFAGRNDNLLDAGSTLYYHNLNECRDCWRPLVVPTTTT